MLSNNSNQLLLPYYSKKEKSKRFITVNKMYLEIVYILLLNKSFTTIILRNNYECIYLTHEQAW